VHNVSQWPNLRHLGESLGGAEGLLEAVSFKKATKGIWVEEESRMPDGSEFQTATLKPREAKVVRTRGADNRLVFASDVRVINRRETRFNITLDWRVIVSAVITLQTVR